MSQELRAALAEVEQLKATRQELLAVVERVEQELETVVAECAESERDAVKTWDAIDDAGVRVQLLRAFRGQLDRSSRVLDKTQAEIAALFPSKKREQQKQQRVVGTMRQRSDALRSTSAAVSTSVDQVDVADLSGLPHTDHACKAAVDAVKQHMQQRSSLGAVGDRDLGTTAAQRDGGGAAQRPSSVNPVLDAMPEVRVLSPRMTCFTCLFFCQPSLMCMHVGITLGIIAAQLDKLHPEDVLHTLTRMVEHDTQEVLKAVQSINLEKDAKLLRWVCMTVLCPRPTDVFYWLVRLGYKQGTLGMDGALPADASEDAPTSSTSGAASAPTQAATSASLATLGAEDEIGECGGNKGDFIMGSPSPSAGNHVGGSPLAPSPTMEGDELLFMVRNCPVCHLLCSTPARCHTVQMLTRCSWGVWVPSFGRGCVSQDQSPSDADLRRLLSDDSKSPSPLQPTAAIEQRVKRRSKSTSKRANLSPEESLHLQRFATIDTFFEAEDIANKVCGVTCVSPSAADDPGSRFSTTGPPIVRVCSCSWHGIFFDTVILG